jgi:hypothetical protein
MSLWVRAAVLAVLGIAVAGTAACRGGILGRQYEYEEDLFLSLDGSATLVVNASLPALVALRGLDLDLNPATRVDLNKIRTAYESPVSEVTRVSGPWRRAGRRFVQVRMQVPDIRKLGDAGPFAWSRYTLKIKDGYHVFEQEVGPSAFKPGTLQKVGWDGSEVVAFRLHLPSRILWHNARDLETNQASETKRGNILAWEQHLTDRLEGVPLYISVKIDSQSILYRTLWLFAGAFAAAVAVLGFIIWMTVRKGAKEAASEPGVRQ